MAAGLRKEVIQPNDRFWQVLSQHRRQSVQELQAEFIGRRFIALDPGETTGVAIWSKGYAELFQIETKEIGRAYEDLKDIVSLLNVDVDHLRVEEYRIYNWMADQHSWSILHTPQLIGAIKVLAHLENIPMSLKLAQHAKAVWNDDVLKLCGLYSPGLKHARDASRHLFYYMAFPNKED